MPSGVPSESEARRDTGRVNRLYAVLSKVNEAIVRIRDPLELFDAACCIAVEDGGLLLAWIGMVEPDTRFIQCVASCGNDDGYLDGVSISLDDSVPEGRGPTGTALRDGRPFINNDTENNPVMRPWREEQLRRGFRSSASFPLRNSGETIGVITLYAGHPGYFDDEEVQLLVRLAEDFSFALQAAETAHEREEARELLRKSRDDLEVRVTERTEELRAALAEQRERSVYAEALSEIERSVGSTLQVDEVMQRALDAGVAALGLECGTVEIRDGQTWMVRYVNGFPSESAGLVLSNAEAPLACAVAELGRPYTVIDLGERPDLGVGFFKRNLVRSLIALPLIVKGDVVGCVLLGAKTHLREFTQADIDFANRFGAAVTFALENARLYEAEHEARDLAVRELETTSLLLESAGVLSRALDLNEVLRSLADVVLRLTGLTRAFVNLIDVQAEVLTPIVATAGLASPLGVAIPFDQLSTTSLEAIRGKRTVCLDYERPEVPAHDREIAESNNVRTVLFAPLLVAGEIVGHVSLDEPGLRHEFTPREIERVEGIASQAAVAIEKARLVKAKADETALLLEAEHASAVAESMRAARLAVLREVGDAAMSSLDAARMAKRFAEIVRDRFCAKYVIVFLAEEEIGLLVPLGATGFAEGYFESYGDAWRIDGDTQSALSYRTGRTEHERDVAELDDQSDAVSAVRRATAIRGSMAVPLKARDQAVGTLSIAWEGIHEYEADEIAFFEAIATEMATGIQNALLFEAEVEVHRRAEALNEIARVAHSTLDYKEIMAQIVSHVVRETGVDAAALHVNDGSAWTFAYTEGSPPDVGELKLPDSQVPITTRVVQTRAPYVSNNISQDTTANSELTRRLGTRSLLAVPLIVRGTVVAVLLCFYFTEKETFSQTQVEFIQQASATLALALENARLYESQREVADRLQNALLDMPDAIHGLEFANAYHSATESSRVGGDFYDVFELDQGHVGITIGDVAGKESTQPCSPHLPSTRFARTRRIETRRPLKSWS